MKMVLIFFLMILYVNPGHTTGNGGMQNSNESPGILLLKSGFEKGVQISDDMNRITGSDVAGFAWENTPSWIRSSRFAYVIKRGNNPRLFEESYIEKIIGPHGKETNVLCLKNKADDPESSATSRNEFSFFGKEAPEDYKEGYVRYWMKFEDNLDELIPMNKELPFYLILEWKEPDSRIVRSQAECKECCEAAKGGTNNYRINVNLKRNNKSGKFNWYITGEHPQPCRVTEWTYSDYNVEVPIGGKWFLVEAYLKKHDSEGRVYFAVNGKVILDTNVSRPEGFTGRTQHKDNPMHLAFWSPMKNYHSMDWNIKGPVSQWYDDFELWSSFPPDHPATKKKNSFIN